MRHWKDRNRDVAQGDAQPRGRDRRVRLAALAAVLPVLVALMGADDATLPKPFRQYLAAEYYDFPLPPDYKKPAEWVFARLMYPSFPGLSRFSLGGDWTEGGTEWTIDYPRADRHVADMVKRLTRLDARSVEQPVNLDDGADVFNWPWLYAVEVGHWDLTDAQAAKLREYLLRGGFLMVDDFHGSIEWQVFQASMQRVFPDRPIVDIPDDDPIFHSYWELTNREQIPGAQFLQTGRTYEQDGYEPHWRAIYDDQGRIMVAICHDMDLGDSVEHADDPAYPERYSTEGMRIFINYIIYSMTH
ncbi:MAG TPA: DUF4159 domain-containing protein [Gammaproteobacteria bacterium]|nr:DUF4159 domain-containing protein [Gammaproteobacteria bacterium]